MPWSPISAGLHQGYTQMPDSQRLVIRFLSQQGFHSCPDSSHTGCECMQMSEWHLAKTPLEVLHLSAWSVPFSQWCDFSVPIVGRLLRATPCLRCSLSLAYWFSKFWLHSVSNNSKRFLIIQLQTCRISFLVPLRIHGLHLPCRPIKVSLRLKWNLSVVRPQPRSISRNWIWVDHPA